MLFHKNSGKHVNNHVYITSSRCFMAPPDGLPNIWPLKISIIFQHFAI